MMPQREREVIIVVGQTGSGKTAWTRSYIARLKRLIALDPIGEYPGEYFNDPRKMIQHIKEHNIFSVKSMNRDDLSPLCGIACAVHAKWCENRQRHVCKRGDVTLVIEEAQAMAPQSSEKLPETLEDVIYRGRHYFVTPILVAQRAATIHIAARSQWTRMLVFSQTEDADVKWLEGATRIPKETFAELPPLHGFDVRRWQKPRPFKLDFTHSGYAKMVPIDRHAEPYSETINDHKD